MGQDSRLFQSNVEENADSRRPGWEALSAKGLLPLLPRHSQDPSAEHYPILPASRSNRLAEQPVPSTVSEAPSTYQTELRFPRYQTQDDIQHKLSSEHRRNAWVGSHAAPSCPAPGYHQLLPVAPPSLAAPIHLIQPACRYPEESPVSLERSANNHRLHQRRQDKHQRSNTENLEGVELPDARQ